MAGSVYFIQGIKRGSQGHKGGPIKIGWTSGTIEGRLSSLQTGSPVKLVILGWMPEDSITERDLHIKFARFRQHGEWFKASKVLLRFIETECYSWPDGVRLNFNKPPRHGKAFEYGPVRRWAEVTEWTILGVKMCVFDWARSTNMGIDELWQIERGVGDPARRNAMYFKQMERIEDRIRAGRLLPVEPYEKWTATA